MTVLIVTSLFHPEIAANAKRMTHLAESLKENGHRVSVITAFPYYATSSSGAKYKSKLIDKSEYQGIPVIRTYAYSPGAYGNLIRRLLCFVSFMATSILGAFKTEAKADVVVAISPPFFSLISGYIISRIKGACLVIDIQDIYPETLIALGFLKNKIVIRLLECLERFLYRKAAGIVVISDGFRRNLVSKGADPKAVAVVHNWVDLDQFKHRDRQDLRRIYGLDGRFAVLFVGTMGFAQALENVIEAARLLRDYRDQMEFVFLGAGSRKEHLEELVREYGLSNVTFIPPQPNSDIPDFISLADVCLTYLKKKELYDITIPCKTYEYMSVGKPVIIGAKGEALKLVTDANCGVGVEPESPEDLAKAILRMYKDRDLIVGMGARGRNYVAANFGRDKMISRYVDFIDRCSAESRR